MIQEAHKEGIDLFVTDHFPVIGGLSQGTLLTVHDGARPGVCPASPAA